MIHPDTPSANHHGSHRHLLTAQRNARSAKVDAIIVPTARPVAYLRKAVALARELDCVLVALCSLRASADEAFELARKSGVRIVAFNMSELRLGALREFITSTLLRRTTFQRRTDTSLKRNLGLLMAQAAQWQRIVFLDDDITVPRPVDLELAAGLLGDNAAVGLAVGGFPDNSVVCHAYRDAGGPQDSFIGGGALAVGVNPATSFFPNIYNEDWFFLLDDTGLQSVACAGHAVQAPYDPYRDPMRARGEELGDSLAEGIFWLFDHGGKLTDADEADYWRDSLSRRRQFIDEVIDRVLDAEIDTATRVRMIAALKGAKGRNLLIEPRLCVDYLQAWRTDREIWATRVADVRRKFGQQPKGLEKLLASLGLMHRYRAGV